MIEAAEIFNELAQGIRPMPQGIEWFSGLGGEEKAAALRLLSHFCVQARATSDDGPTSIQRSGLRETHTPAVLIARGPINVQLWKIASLAPEHERLKAFRLLIAVLGVADERRRQLFCVGGCGHYWHHLPSPNPGPR
ncbi:DUF5958 family protein [Streptomyces sp. NPDC051561]|uniref:DUF5958 family protein n=1 Tax=Streptomyces sp. NPDC051561 TaxID=3365658 RepID=UPI0037AEFF87